MCLLWFFAVETIPVPSAAVVLLLLLVGIVKLDKNNVFLLHVDPVQGVLREGRRIRNSLYFN